LKLNSIKLKKTLPFFSYIFHPIFIPIIGTGFYIHFSNDFYNNDTSFLLFFQVVIITFLLPLSFFYLLKTFGKADNLMLSDASQRKMPLLMQVALTFILINKSVTIDQFPELFFFFLGGIGSTLMAFALIYTKVKASIHMIAISALSFFVIGLCIHNELNIVYTIATLFLTTGIIATSRLYMKAHTMEELLIGYVAGMLPQVVLWAIWL
jgi:hypothetical protein